MIWKKDSKVLPIRKPEFLPYVLKFSSHLLEDVKHRRGGFGLIFHEIHHWPLFSFTFWGEKNPNYLLVKQHLEFRASLLYLSGCTHKIPIVTSYMTKGFPLGTPTHYKITLTQENNLSYQSKHSKNSRNKMTSHLFSLKPPELQESTSTVDSCSSVHPL